MGWGENIGYHCPIPFMQIISLFSPFIEWPAFFGHCRFGLLTGREFNL